VEDIFHHFPIHRILLNYEKRIQLLRSNSGSFATLAAMRRASSKHSSRSSIVQGGGKRRPNRRSAV